MKARDRLMVIGLVALAVLGAGWFLLVAPEREQAAKLAEQVSAAQQQLTSARSQVANARGAQAQYAQAYTSIVRLGKAVPPEEQVPSLVYQLDQVSNQKLVDFSSITTSAGAGGASPAATSPTAAAAAAAASASGKLASFTQMPFTFIFNGTFFGLNHMLAELNRFTVRTAAGNIQVTGRLLTVQSVNMAIKQNSAGTSNGQLTATITATAYALPPSQGLTGGATPAGPAGTGTQTVAGSGSSAASTPAVVKVTP